MTTEVAVTGDPSASRTRYWPPSFSIDITSAPALARFERSDDGVADRAGVPERRRVAAADVPAGQGRPQVHPFRPEPEAFLASVRCLQVYLPDHAQVGVAHRRRWRARCFASAAHLPMLAGGRGPHIIRPASSVLGRGTGLAGRGMAAGP